MCVKKGVDFPGENEYFLPGSGKCTHLRSDSLVVQMEAATSLIQTHSSVRRTQAKISQYDIPSNALQCGSSMNALHFGVSTKKQWKTASYLSFHIEKHSLEGLS